MEKYHHWTREEVELLAKSCKTLGEFTSKYRKAKDFAYLHGFIHEFGWLYNQCRKKRTYEECYSIAKSCKTQKEFKEKDNAVYAYAYAHGWIKDYTWFVRVKHPDKYTREAVFAESHKYEGLGRRAFYKGSMWAYAFALHRGWLDEMPWLGIGVCPYKGTPYSVYAYEFKKSHSVYVGLTINPHKRHLQHSHFDGKKEKSSVWKWSQYTRERIPEMKILKDKMCMEEAQYREDELKKMYERDGWNVLNKGVTGIGKGSLGGSGAHKWTHDKCMAAVLECRTRVEFQRRFYGAWQASKKHGWEDVLDAIPSLNHPAKPKPVKIVHITSDDEIIAEMNKHSTRTEFFNANSKLYNLAMKRGLLSIPDKCAPRKIVSTRESDGAVRVFDNAYVASSTLGICRSNVVQCCRGKKKHIHGYKFTYAA